MARSSKGVNLERHPKSTGETFGEKPPEIAIGGGKMCTFGHKPNSGVWPTNIVSTDQKTGFPKGFEGRTKKGR